MVIGTAMGIVCLCAIVTCVVYDFKARYALLVIMASGLWTSNGLSLVYASSTFFSMPVEVRGISLAFVNAMVGHATKGLISVSNTNSLEG